MQKVSRVNQSNEEFCREFQEYIDKLFEKSHKWKLELLKTNVVLQTFGKIGKNGKKYKKKYEKELEKEYDIREINNSKLSLQDHDNNKVRSLYIIYDQYDTQIHK